jgi:Icc protein
MSDNPLYFVHISDTHFGPTHDFKLYGKIAYAQATKIVEAINALPVPPDFLVHTGDIASHPDDLSYRLAADVLSRVRVPVYYVIGNHDAAELVRRFLPMGERTSILEDDRFLTYAFESRGYRFVALDARGPDEIDPHGVLGTQQFDFLESEFRKDQKPVIVFVHFPPLSLDSRWFDQNMLLLNGEILHQFLVPIKERVRGVFFGHVHRGIQILRDGILYSAVASTVGQFFAWPHDEHVKLDLHHPPCFNFVTLRDGQTIIKEHTLSEGPES